MYNHRVNEKTLDIRMKVFNYQIFNTILKNHCKDNATMNYKYLEKTYNYLYEKALFNDSINLNMFISFINKYDSNLKNLHNKKIE